MRGASLTIMLFSALCLIGLHVYGHSERKGGEFSVVSVDAPAQAFIELQKQGFRGRTIVVLSNRLYFEAKTPGSLAPAWMQYPFDVFSLSDVIEESLADGNVLWVSLEKGVARNIIHVIPDERFSREMKKAVRYRGVRVSPEQIDAPFYGAQRTLVKLDTLPPIVEPVILFVDPTFFEDVPGEEVFHALKGKVTPALIISCSFEDDKSISGEKRESLLRFVTLMESLHG